MILRIKNWSEFQHFKDRNPPWIKLYKSILDRHDIAMISDRNFRILIGLWLIASEDNTKNGTLPEISQISFRLRRSEDEINEALQELSEFLIHDDINMISSGYKNGIQRREEKRREEAESKADYFSEKELKQFRKQCPSLSDQEFKNEVTNCELWIKAHGSKTPELTLSKWVQRAEKEKPKRAGSDGLAKIREAMQ